jgi:hypothetical protein
MINTIMNEFKTVDEEIRKKLDEIFDASLPSTPNPFFNYGNLGQLDEEYLQSIMSKEAEIDHSK